MDPVVEALVLGPCHVGQALCHWVGHAKTDELLLVRLERRLLKAHLFTEVQLGDDLGHVVKRKILGTKQGNLTEAAPAVIQQKTRRCGGNVACCDAGQLAVAVDRGEEHAPVADGRSLADDIVHERRVAERTKGDTRAGNQIVHCERRRDVTRTVGPRRTDRTPSLPRHA